MLGSTVPCFKVCTLSISQAAGCTRDVECIHTLFSASQTNKQTNRQTNKQTNKQPKQTTKQSNKQWATSTCKNTCKKKICKHGNQTTTTARHKAKQKQQLSHNKQKRKCEHKRQFLKKKRKKLNSKTLLQSPKIQKKKRANPQDKNTNATTKTRKNNECQQANTKKPTRHSKHAKTQKNEHKFPKLNFKTFLFFAGFFCAGFFFLIFFSLFLFRFCFFVQFFCRFLDTLSFAWFGLKVPRRQTSPPPDAPKLWCRDCKTRRSKKIAAATSRLRFVNIMVCRTRSGRAFEMHQCAGPHRTEPMWWWMHTFRFEFCERAPLRWKHTFCRSSTQIVICWNRTMIILIFWKRNHKVEGSSDFAFEPFLSVWAPLVQ